MKTLMRGGALAALTLAACAVAGGANAQSYNRLVVFGDSLSDNGNLYLASGGTQPPSPPYFQGRFSSGPVFTELLGFTVGRSAAGAPVTGSINYAYGGARTDSSAFPPGMRLQLTAYTAAGGRFGAGDLVSILGGANNIFQGLPAAGASANPTGTITPVATSAATDVNFIANTAAAAGAGTVVVTNLPRLSLTPQFRGTAAAPLADFAATTFNTAVLTQLTATAAARPGTNIIVVDLFKASDVFAASPAAFGVTNATAACFNGVTVCANPDSYFYFDGVHPTATGHRAIAALVNDYIYYADRGAEAALQGEFAYRHREEGLETATESLSGRGPWEEGAALSMELSGDAVDVDARGAVGEAEADGWAARAALEQTLGGWRVGLAGTWRESDVETAGTDLEITSYGLDAYAGWRNDSLFLNAAAGIAGDDYDSSRRTGVGPIVHTAASDGHSTGARVQGGAWFDAGGIALSPRVAVTWLNAEVGGYVEEGAAAQLEHRLRSLSAVTAEAVLRAEAGMGDFSVFVEGGYRDAVTEDFDAVRVGIWGNPAQVLEREAEDPFGGQALAGAGVEGELGPVRVSVGYRGRFGEHADSHMGAVRFTLPIG
jgi:outer membrane lipase/esterase